MKALLTLLHQKFDWNNRIHFIIACALIFALTFFVAAILTGCGKEVSMSELEDQKVIARDNSLLNAQAWKGENPQYNSFKAIPNGDSTQTRVCPQGDGWATITLFKEGEPKVKIKCSTYSAATSCVPESEFGAKPFAKEEGRCNTQLDAKLNKIAQ